MLPFWLKDGPCLQLDLEAAYHRTCQQQRMLGYDVTTLLRNATMLAHLPCSRCCPSRPSAAAQENKDTKRTEDVIYGRKYGIALTMDVFTPPKPNGAAVIWVVSGGWFSSHEAINPGFAEPFVKRGYTVFAVVHGSQPKFTIPEILEDMHRAVRFIRPTPRTTGSTRSASASPAARRAGTCRSCRAWPGRPGDPKAKDPVDRASSRVQAVACFFPPTDFLNYGKPGEDALGRGVLPRLQGAVRLPRARQGDQLVRADHRRGEASGDRPQDLADQPRHARTTRRR